MEKFLKCSEVAELLNLHPTTLRQYVRKGFIKHRRNAFGWIEIREDEISRIKEIISQSREHFLHGAKRCNDFKKGGHYGK